MYIFIDAKTIQAYNGEILKRYVGSKLIKTIANPTNEQLAEFGYKELVEQEMPEYNQETQYLETKYVDGEVITKTYEVKDIPTEEPEMVENIQGE